MIETIALVRSRWQQDFVDELSAALNQMQADGYEVEIQYSVESHSVYTALLIGRLTQ